MKARLNMLPIQKPSKIVCQGNNHCDLLFVFAPKIQCKVNLRHFLIRRFTVHEKMNAVLSDCEVLIVGGKRIHTLL
jgi:hypothetical protein